MNLKALNQNEELAKVVYEKPVVTTFGTVAKLTMTGGTDPLPDHSMSTRKRPTP